MGQPMGMPMGGMGMGGGRVVFNGDGGKLFVTYLMYLAAPMVVGYIVVFLMAMIGGALDRAIGAGGIIGGILGLIGALAFLAVILIGSTIYVNKFYAFYYEALLLDGQPCQYTGTPGELAKVMIVNMLLTSITCGIYTPWAIVRIREFVDSKVLVAGQPNRLTFHGDPSSLLGTYILGQILSSITCGIYMPWFANDLFAFMWENTRLDGRAYQFRKDPGGFFGTYLITMLLTSITCGIYYPWGICNIFKWEAERVS